MSRIRPVRSITLQCQARSRLRCCTGDSAASTIATVTSCSAIASPCAATWPVAQQRRRAGGAQRQDGGVHDHEPDGGGQSDRFGQAVPRPRAASRRRAPGRVLPGQDDRGAGRACRSLRPGPGRPGHCVRLRPLGVEPCQSPVTVLISRAGRASGPALGLRGVEQLDRSARHHSADGMLVDELGMPVAPQQNRKIVEPGNDALQFDTVHQEHRHRCLVLPHMVQEHVLNILRFFIGHSRSFLLSLYRRCCAFVIVGPGGHGATHRRRHI